MISLKISAPSIKIIVNNLFGLAKLHDFDLQRDTECYSKSDRTALIDIIARWFSDTHSGETDPERLRQLGIHRFETFVRFEIAPRLTRHDQALSHLHTLCVVQTGLLGYALDTYAMPALTSTMDFLILLCVLLWMAVVWIPLTLGILRVGAWAAVALRERCRCYQPIAFAIALLIVLVLTWANWVRHSYLLAKGQIILMTKSD